LTTIELNGNTYTLPIANNPNTRRLLCEHNIQLTLDGTGFFFHEKLPDLDIEGLRLLVKWAEIEYEAHETSDHQSAWQQDTWGIRSWDDELHRFNCGTAFCIAGKYAYDHVLPDQLVWADDQLDFVVDPSNDCLVSVGEFAQHGLGLTSYEANSLFSGGNTHIDSIKRIATDIAATRGYEL
jgi:hypothetical protein